MSSKEKSFTGFESDTTSIDMEDFDDENEAIEYEVDSLTKIKIMQMKGNVDAPKYDVTFNQTNIHVHTNGAFKCDGSQVTMEELHPNILQGIEKLLIELQKRKTKDTVVDLPEEKKPQTFKQQRRRSLFRSRSLNDLRSTSANARPGKKLSIKRLSTKRPGHKKPDSFTTYNAEVGEDGQTTVEVTRYRRKANPVSLRDMRKNAVFNNSICRTYMKPLRFAITIISLVITVALLFILAKHFTED